MRCEPRQQLAALAADDVDDARRKVAGGEHLGKCQRGQGPVLWRKGDDDVAPAERRRQAPDESRQGRRLGRHDPDDAGGLGDGEVEVGPGDRVDRAGDLRQLVGPARVPDQGLDRLLELSARLRAAAQQIHELGAPAVEHLGRPIEDLAAIHGCAAGPARKCGTRSPHGVAKIFA